MSRLESLNKISQLNYGKDLNGGLRQATGISKDINGISQQLYGQDANASFTQLKTLIGGRVLSLPGVTGSYISTTDKASLDIIGDIDFRIEVAESILVGANRALVSKWNPTTQQSYEYRYSFLHTADMVWSTAGNNALSNVGPDLASSHLANRVTLDVANGTDRVITYYRALTLAGPWELVRQDVVAGTTSIFAGTAPLRIGARANASGDNAFQGKIRRMELRDGIDGTVVANPDFRFLAPGTTSFNDTASTPNTWTIAGTAAII